MKKALIVINQISGNSASIDEKKIFEIYEKEYEIHVAKIVDEHSEWSGEGYDLVVVCGGDGTFNRAINNNLDSNAEMVYYSFGTFNECAKAKGISKHDKLDKIKLEEYATANDDFFSYVLAAGTFTPLGYVVDTKKKKKFGILAYLSKVIAEYKVNSIKAKIVADGIAYEDNYTIIMVIDSMRCFGFKFNKLYEPNNRKVQILLLKSPGKNTFINKIKIFFPMFRAFFIGFKKEYQSKKMLFKTVENVSIFLDNPEIFNIDGESMRFDDRIDIQVKIPKNNIYIGNAELIQK